jgi:hypothetical protein
MEALASTAGVTLIVSQLAIVEVQSAAIRVRPGQ